MRVRPTREAWILGGIWAGASLAAVTARSWLPAVAAFLPVCPLHAWLGVPCMACGSTRAALHLAGGDFAAAFLANPLAATVLAIGWVGGLLALPWLALGWRAPSLPTQLPRPARVALAATLLANWCFLVARGI